MQFLTILCFFVSKQQKREREKEEEVESANASPFIGGRRRWGGKEGEKNCERYAFFEESAL